MATEVKVAAKKRSELGSLAARRLRRTGMVPANVYGHGEGAQALVMSKVDVITLVKHGAHVVSLDVEGTTTKVLLKEVQWDYLGSNVQHIDLMRVDPNQKIHVQVHVELRGTPVGMAQGGVLEHPLRSIDLECSATEIPDSIVLKVAGLEIGHTIHVRELELPPNTRALNNADAIVVRVVKPVEQAIPVPGEGPVQPEVIGKKDEKKEEEAAAGKKEGGKK